MLTEDEESRRVRGGVGEDPDERDSKLDRERHRKLLLPLQDAINDEDDDRDDEEEEEVDDDEEEYAGCVERSGSLGRVRGGVLVVDDGE